ncbi:MAG: 50S ribosomal protein L11 methyltransferase [Chitinophagaceae bacterium]|nr:50S ribosomal protein L11 methyltransferase [Chitinophagaceae bacterium]
MPNFIQIEFQNINATQSDLLLAQLNEMGFTGFEELENSLKAFIPAQDFDEVAIVALATKDDLTYSKSDIAETNWNAVWESNFQPVLVDDYVGIRADFHEPLTGVDYEIVITPKMSFGTGHHATTYMMIQQMRKIDFTGALVFDFGTGTGILAILAEKSGAKKIIAVDNDDWSIANSKENAVRNNCTKIEFKKTERIPEETKFDIILANINKNVILANFSSLVNQLAPDGILLLSGLLEADEADLLPEAGKYPLVYSGKSTKNSWIALRFNL